MYAPWKGKCTVNRYLYCALQKGVCKCLQVCVCVRTMEGEVHSEHVFVVCTAEGCV